MFTTVRYFIKTSVVFLIIGLITGLYLMIANYFNLPGYNQEIISAHTHLILIGFVMMMIMGVAIWFFPRPEKGDKKYNPDLIRFVYWLITTSTALRFIFQMLYGFLFIKWFTYIITIASFLQIVSFVLLFYSVWNRIRPVGSHIREKRGEKF